MLCGAAGIEVRAATPASLPYVPSVSARHHLQRLADEAGLALPLTQWPLPAQAVREALDELPTDLPDALAAARDALRRDLARAAQADASLQLRSRKEAPVGFGDNYTPGTTAALHTSDLSGAAAMPSWLDARLGVRIEQAPVSDALDLSAPATTTRAPWRLDDSALVAQALGLNLQLSATPHWWGPGWQSSLILGNNTPQWIAFGAQRASARAPTTPWLAWVGPWSFEFFIAKARDPAVVAQQPTGFLMSGLRLSFKPHPQVEVGLSRTIQTDGEGRPGGVRNFLRAFFGTGLNADTAAQAAVDPANEMAGYDLRVSCGRARRCAFYGQMIGEDQAGILPSKFLGLFGVEAWSADGAQRWYAEYANTYCGGVPGKHTEGNCAYRNGHYQQGYTNGTRWSGASQGPDSRLLTLGWLSEEGEQLLRAHIGRVGVSLGAYVPGIADPPHGKLLGLQAQRSYALGPITLTPAFAWTQLSQGADVGSLRRRNLQLGVQAQWSLP